MLLIDRDPCFTCLAQEVGRVSGRCQRAAMGCCCCVSASAAAPPPAFAYVGCWVTGCIGYRLFGYPFSKFSHQKIIACFVCVFFGGCGFNYFCVFHPPMDHGVNWHKTCFSGWRTGFKCTNVSRKLSKNKTKERPSEGSNKSRYLFWLAW